MRILVTGGAGYIGSHTAKALAAEGFEPIVVDNLSTGHRDAVRWGPLIEADVSDCVAVREVLQKCEIGAVIHFAANAYVRESLAEPRKYLETNISTSLSLLAAMLDVGVRHLVFSSSCATYGKPAEVPISENHAQSPLSPYGESKLYVEHVLRWYGQAYGFHSAALRYFNAAGLDPQGELGEHHEPETHLVPLALRAALDSSSALEVFGTEHETPDGTTIRDYVHVSDLAKAHVLSLKYLLDGGPSAAFNLGSGRGASVREVVAEVERITGRRVKTRVRERCPGDAAVLVADSSLAQRVLGWKPAHSSLDRIVSTAFAWLEREEFACK